MCIRDSCRIPTRCAQTGMRRALATVSPLHARPLRPSEGKRRFPLISAGISLFIIHCSLLIINYHEEVCLEYHSQSDHSCCYRHRRGLRPASLPIVLASLPHPFPLPKEDNLPKKMCIRDRGYISQHTPHHVFFFHINPP